MNLDQLITLLTDIRDGKGGELPVFATESTERYRVVTGQYQAEILYGSGSYNLQPEGVYLEVVW